MTIAAAYLTSDGVVLGADSTSTISVKVPGAETGEAVVQLLNHAQKVFEVGLGGRFGVCTYGTGHVKGVSQRTLVARLADRVDDGKTTVQGAVAVLQEEVQRAMSGPPGGGVSAGVLGYYLGGWNPGSHEPGCAQLEFAPDGSVAVNRALVFGEASFSGSHIFFSRVFHGFDPRLPEMLYGQLRQMDGMPNDYRERFEAAFNAVAPQLQAGGYRDLPIREAVDFVHSYLHVTIKASKFAFGPPVAGGPIEIGFITADRRFRWACHKSHSSAIWEQEATRDGQ